MMFRLKSGVEIVRICLFSLFLGLACVLPVHANDRISEAEQLIADLIEELEQVTANQSANDVQSQQYLSTLVNAYFDVDAITRFSVGAYWRIATQAEREDYAELFRTVLINQASAQFHRLKSLQFKPTRTRAKGDKFVLVGGMIHDKSGEFNDVEIFWRVVTLPGKPAKVFDVEIENISMLKTQQDENTSLIRRNAGRFSALNEALQERLAEPPPN